MANFWWANQGRSFSVERGLGALWAPQVGRAGQNVVSFESLTSVAVGDVVFHYSGQSVRAVSRVTAGARAGLRPHGDDDRVGWEVRVELIDVPPLPLSRIPETWRTAGMFTGSAFNRHGGVNNGYVFGVTREFGVRLLEELDLIVLDGESTTDRPVGEDGRHLEPVFRFETDGTAVRTYRKEQSWLSGVLFGTDATGSCDLCGKHLPRRLLRTAHIKPRAQCTPEERRDPNVVFIACTLGCDALYEDGYVTVGSDGIVQACPATPTTASVDAAIENLVGRVAGRFNAQSATYFSWHREAHQQARSAGLAV